MACEICPLLAIQKVGCSGVQGSCSRPVVGSDSIPSGTSRSHSSASFRSSKPWNTGARGRLQLVRPRSFRTGAVLNESHRFFPPPTSTERPCDQSLRGEGSNLLEDWLQRSVTEIVRHLPEAPFMQLVKHDCADGHADRHKLSDKFFEKPETWAPVKKSLLESAPDGIILVHRLNPDSPGDCCLNENIGSSTCNRETSWSEVSSHNGAFRTDVWGLLVQGCSVHSHACYILKTTRVASSTGILTHFGVSRAKCFGPSLQCQLESTWLL